MNVLIFGGTGLLGSAAAQIFVDRGHSVKTVASPHIPKGLDCRKKCKSFTAIFFKCLMLSLSIL